MDILMPMVNMKKKARRIKGGNKDYENNPDLQDNNLEEVIRNNEETVERICINVAAYAVISNSLKIALQSTFDPTTTNALCKHVLSTIIPLANSCVRDIDPTDSMVYMRIKTKNCEYLVGPEEEFTVIVQQN